MKNFLKKDIVQRIIRTFIQGFCASMVISLGSINSANFSETKVIIESALIGATASGLCAIMNLIINYLDNKEV